MMTAKKQSVNKWFLAIAIYNLVAIVLPFGILFVLSSFGPDQPRVILENLMWMVFLVFLGISSIALVKGARWAWVVQVIFFLSQVAVVRVGEKLFSFNLNLMKFGFNFKTRFLESDVDVTFNLIPVIIFIVLLTQLRRPKAVPLSGERPT